MCLCGVHENMHLARQLSAAEHVGALHVAGSGKRPTSGSQLTTCTLSDRNEPHAPAERQGLAGIHSWVLHTHGPVFQL
jgi:hypothetical protein